ncbi:MAG: hypothetical protein K9N55_19280 [Phycisphaerae bacterium]|nr:hypothetical protein [Phycisphaerae bacterium]
MKQDRRQRGLSLVETLVAGMILSATVVTVSALSTRSMAGAGINRTYEQAAALINRQMTLIDCVGISAFLEAGQTQGEFGELAPEYTWAMAAESVGIDNLYEVTMTVYWAERGGIKSLSVTTRLNGPSVLADTTSL